MHGEGGDAAVSQAVEAHFPVDAVGEDGAVADGGVHFGGVEGERGGVETAERRLGSGGQPPLTTHASA